MIVRDGLRRMFVDQENVFYYITVMNENYAHPAMPEGVEEGIVKGMYLLRESQQTSGRPQVKLLGSGTILREVEAAAEILERDFGVAPSVWSVTSFNELNREGLDVARWNLLHPQETPKLSYVEQCLGDRPGPVANRAK